MDFRPPPPGSASLLRGFRASAPPAPLPPAERRLLGLLIAHLAFLPWALGTVHAWSQWTSLGLAAAGLLLALRPRAESERPGPAFARRVGRRLLRFPVFWAGLAWLLYMAAQGLNPAWHYASNGSVWWLEPAAHWSGGPHGVSVPWGQAGVGPALRVHASLWLLVCSAWIGLQRRRSWRLLFTALVINATLLAVFGILEQITAAPGVFWQLPTSTSSFAATFIYRNHAGAYFNLLLAVAAGLAWWHFQRAERRLARSSPAGLFTLAAVIIGTMALFTHSRFTALLTLGFAAAVLTAFVLHVVFCPSAQRHRGLLVGLALLFAAAGGTGLFALRFDRVWQRLEHALNNPVASSRDRAQARQAATQMLADNWLLGWGAGCFRYGFPPYAMRYPEIYYTGPAQRKFWEHAHNDLLEYPIEFGLVGLSPAGLMLGFGCWRLARQRFWRNVLALLIVAGLLLTLVHSGADFVFQCPAILLTWALLFAGAARWAELDAANAGEARAGRDLPPGAVQAGK